MGAEEHGPVSGIRKFALSKADGPALVISIACFMGNIGVGACVGSLGPAVPILAELTDSSEAALGVLFTMRGVGYFAGTALTTAVMHVETILVSKALILVSSCLCVSFGMGLLTWTEHPPLLMVAALLQGVGCGGMDLGTNCIVADAWGDRIQPWMQALHACFGIGALVGPALVGLLGYTAGFRIMALLLVGAATIAMLKQYVMNGNGHYQECRHSSDAVKSEVELTGATQSPVHSGDSVRDVDIVDQALRAVQLTRSPAAAETEASPPVAPTAKVPSLVQVLCFLFFFVYVGIETGFGGWVPTYSLKEGITADKSQAAYLTAVFYGSLAAGRIVSVPLSIYLSSTTMIRIQLLISLVGGLAFFFVGDVSYELAYVSCSVFGAGLSALFPLMLVLPMEYGMVMDDATTSRFIIGGTIGEALLPIFIGHTMSYFGPTALLYDTLFIAVTMVLLYITSHCYIVLGPFAAGKSPASEYASLPVNEEGLSPKASA